MMTELTDGVEGGKPLTRSVAITGLAAGAGLGLASGALVVFSFDPFGLWALIFVAFVPMIV